MFVPHSKGGYANGSYSSTPKPLDMDWGDFNPNNHGHLEFPLHFWYKIRELAEQMVGERSTQERSSKSPCGKKSLTCL